MKKKTPNPKPLQVIVRTKSERQAFIEGYMECFKDIRERGINDVLEFIEVAGEEFISMPLNKNFKKRTTHPWAQCSGCKRVTYSKESEGLVCNLVQPNGFYCTGKFIKINHTTTDEASQGESSS